MNQYQTKIDYKIIIIFIFFLQACTKLSQNKFDDNIHLYARYIVL